MFYKFFKIFGKMGIGNLGFGKMDSANWETAKWDSAIWDVTCQLYIQIGHFKDTGAQV